jgi:AAA+ superfamily predicted ATPase
MSQCLLYNIEKISSAAARCEYNFENLTEIQNDVEFTSQYLDVSSKQCILFACFVELSLQRTVTIESLAKHLKCSVLKIITDIQEIEVLERKGYILKSNKGRRNKYTYTDFGYNVPFNVIESLRTSDKSKLKQSIHFNLPNFLEKVAEMINSREDNSMPTEVLFDQVEFLISNNLDDTFLRFVNKNVKHAVNKCLVFALAFFRFKKEPHYTIESMTQSIFDDLSEQMAYDQSLAARRNELFKNEIIRFQESQFYDDKTIVLTAKTLKILYKNYPELNINNETDDLLIKSLSIKKKELFFEDNLQKQLQNITKVLDKRNFRNYQLKLESKNLHTGITIMFYGKSGTGKTESVFQIAKQINRDILMIELSQLRSKWFGESEKMVKRVFEDYRRLSNNSSVVPILFINEADGMFSKRSEISAKNSSVDQTVNTIQNIILQELENFEGILFATTNLTINLDSAFERRFLFKVEFNNPLPEVSQQIWKSKLPELSQSQIKLLVSRYNLSGGEIENITRKYIIGDIIGDDSLDFDELLSFCELEKPFQKQNRIGFHK